MSGRVRWEGDAHGSAGRALFVAGNHRGDVIPRGDGWRAYQYGETSDNPGEPFARRCDAKRWLLARAAGLAEVPRGASFGTRYGAPQSQVVVSCGPEGMSVPRGWRVADAYVSADEQTIVTLERNRRRR